MARNRVTTKFFSHLIAASFLSIKIASALPINLDFVGEWDKNQKAKDAVLYIKDKIWEPLLPKSFSGEQIYIKAIWDDMTNPTEGAKTVLPTPLKNFGSTFSWYEQDIYYPVSLAEYLHKGDLNPNMPDMTITFYGQYNWYFETDGKTPDGKFDFASIAAHEIAHGLGFSTNIMQTGNYDRGGPQIFDTFLQGDKGNDNYVLLTKMDDEQRAKAITYPYRLFWIGKFGEQANEDLPITLYSPESFKYGSSVVHLDLDSWPKDLMTPSLKDGRAIHTPSAIDMGILRDMGWRAIPEPGTLFLLGTGLGVIGLAAWRRRK